jgi:hypothetical protein
MVQQINKNSTNIAKALSQTGQAIFALGEVMHCPYTSVCCNSLDGCHYTRSEGKNRSLFRSIHTAGFQMIRF